MSAGTLDPTEGLLVYTDGACGKSKVGGWAFIVVDSKLSTYECQGWELDSTNNRMELMACVQALCELDELLGPCEIEIVTDSKYVMDGFIDWLPGWKRKKWMTTSGSEVKNKELWLMLEAAVDLHDWVQWRHVRGHQGHKWNEEVDTLAVQARMEGDKEQINELRSAPQS